MSHNNPGFAVALALAAQAVTQRYRASSGARQMFGKQIARNIEAIVQKALPVADAIPTHSRLPANTQLLAELLDVAKYQDCGALQAMLARALASTADARSERNLQHAFANTISSMTANDEYTLRHIKAAGSVPVIPAPAPDEYRTHVFAQNNAAANLQAQALSLHVLARLGLIAYNREKDTEHAGLTPYGKLILNACG